MSLFDRSRERRGRRSIAARIVCDGPPQVERIVRIMIDLNGSGAVRAVVSPSQRAIIRPYVGATRPVPDSCVGHGRPDGGHGFAGDSPGATGQNPIRERFLAGRRPQSGCGGCSRGGWGHGFRRPFGCGGDPMPGRKSGVASVRAFGPGWGEFSVENPARGPRSWA